MLKLDFLDNNYVDNRSLSEKVCEQLKIEILSGEIKPGRHLTEAYICEKYGLSRPPVREIINRLAAEGYISLIPNKGAVIEGFSSQIVDDLLYMRNNLYPQAVQWAIERMTVDEFDLLQETIGFIQFYTKTGDVEKILKFCDGFDRIIYYAAKNPELESVMLKYDFIIRHSTKQGSYPMNFLEILRDEYEAIFNAVRKRNVPQGTEAAQVHIFRSILRIKARKEPNIR